jgi:predicted anti-sigma-YlaC factor YlaD
MTNMAYLLDRTKIRQIKTVGVAGMPLDVGATAVVTTALSGFEKAPIAVAVGDGWLTARVSAVSATSLSVTFLNASPGSHSGNAAVLLIELY